MNKFNCAGCRDDYYNAAGNSIDGQCWLFDRTKKMEPRFEIHVDLRPPYGKHLIRKVPPCYHKSRFVYVKPEAIGPDGYWK